MLMQKEPLHLFEVDDFTCVLGVQFTDFAYDILGVDHFVVWRQTPVAGSHLQDGGRITESNEEFDRRTREFLIEEPLLEK